MAYAKKKIATPRKKSGMGFTVTATDRATGQTTTRTGVAKPVTTSEFKGVGSMPYRGRRATTTKMPYQVPKASATATPLLKKKTATKK